MVESQQGRNPGSFSLAGAVDLEGVKRKVQARQRQEAQGVNPDALTAPQAGGYVIDVTESSFQSMVQTSATFPIVLVLWSRSDTTTFPLLEQLADAVNALQGRLQLARIEADECASIAQALGAQALPAIYGLIAGRPMPIVQGLPSQDEMQGIVESILPQLLQVAQQAGIAGVAPFMQAQAEDEHDVSKSQAQEQIPQSHQTAHDLAMQGDYAAAAQEYEKIIQMDPADKLAVREHAKALLLSRNINVDVAAIRKAAADHADDVLAQLAVADVDMIDGHIDDAFGRLLDCIARHREELDTLRERLLEYFAMLDASDERVGRARRKLATLLY